MTINQEDNGVNENISQSVRAGSEISKNQPARRSFEVESTERLSIEDDERSNTIPAEDEVDLEKPNSEEIDEKEVDPIPDGGYGWLIVIGAFLVQITSYGLTTSCISHFPALGVMQDYYQRNVFYDLPNPAFQLSFVGTFISVFANCMGPVAHILNSIFGVRVVMSVGTLFIAVGIFIAGFANKVWQLYLTQGVCFGIGVSFMYITIMSVAPQYFDKKRGFALGLVASGSGIGGLVIPFIMTPINRSLGAGWTYRVLGFICLACDVIAVIVVKDRVKRKTGRRKLSELINFDVFKNRNYCIWVAGGTIQLMPYFVPYYYMPAYASWLGLSDSQGSSLVAVASAMNFVGRIVCGLIADRVGHVNTNIIFLTLCCLSNFLIWTFAYSYGSLMAFAVIFGLACGSFFTLVSPLTASILGMDKFPTGLSMLLLFNVVSIFAVNVANAIEDGVDSEPFFSYKIFTGTLYAIAVMIIMCLKLSMNRKFFVKI